MSHDGLQDVSDEQFAAYKKANRLFLRKCKDIPLATGKWYDILECFKCYSGKCVAFKIWIKEEIQDDIEYVCAHQCIVEIQNKTSSI